MSDDCVAYGCTNYRSSPFCKNKSFFRFPKDPLLQKRWIAAIDQRNFNVNSVLCSDHFEDSCFYYIPFTNSRILKPTSVPTKFVFMKENVIPASAIPNSAVSSAEIQDIETLTLFSIFKENEIVSDATFGKSSPLRKTVAIQTDCSFVSLIDELNTVKEELHCRKEELKKAGFSPYNIKTDEHMEAVTGFSKKEFFSFYDFLDIGDMLKIVCKVDPITQFFLFMVKLKTNIGNEILGYLFNVSYSFVSRQFNMTAEILYTRLKEFCLWPSETKSSKTVISDDDDSDDGMTRIELLEVLTTDFLRLVYKYLEKC